MVAPSSEPTAGVPSRATAPLPSPLPRPLKLGTGCSVHGASLPRRQRGSHRRDRWDSLQAREVPPFAGPQPKQTELFLTGGQTDHRWSTHWGSGADPCQRGGRPQAPGSASCHGAASISWAVLGSGWYSVATDTVRYAVWGLGELCARNHLQARSLRALHVIHSQHCNPTFSS